MTDSANPLLWLAWASFALVLLFLLWRKYLPAILQAPPLPKVHWKPSPAWLFCEEGTALDRRAQWFALRPGGCTVVGSRPRAPKEYVSFVYLTAEDIREDHAQLLYNGESGRYEVEALGAGVLHNNEPLEPGEKAELADGDTLDLGRISRFRFTLTGPEAP